MSFDNVCKLLAEKYPASFARWLLGGSQPAVNVLKTELSIEPIRADSVTFLQLQERILHLEFQVRLESDPPLPLRMLDYWVRLHRWHRLPITQVVVLLLPPSPDTPIPSCFELETTRHSYRVIPLWQQDPEPFLQDPALLPLASLTATSDDNTLLQQVAQRVMQLEERQRQETAAYVQILAGLVFKKRIIQQIFGEEVMRESVIYQDILEKGLQQGRQIGRQEGRQEGHQEGRQQEGQVLILRQLTRLLGSLPEPMQSRISSLSLEQLENLGEALFDFSDVADLGAWLENLTEF
ncbi:MAG: Rpn family recombination-promoting nuclease/putative transposase [Synechococcaceae cyanobacterium SM2_3_2]|nr:Rpn family recombination-promoting nuclease/putative transposase [Synechococcaceae cyanobacterium SM2_3_2]